MTDVRSSGPAGLARGALVSAGIGVVVLAAEFATVRASAPWFGQSAFAWSGAVAVLLLALALGYAAGGRIAERDPTGRTLPVCLGFAGLWLALSSAAAGPLAQLLVPSEVGADRPLPLALWGSLIQTSVLLGPAMVLAGAASPLLVRRLTTTQSVARRAGLLSAAGTLGSLLGCALAPMVLIPLLGARGTLAAGGAVLGALGLVCGRGRDVRVAVVEAPEVGVGLPLALRLTLCAGFVGLAVTIVEFAAARALAPAYGASNPVWAGIIAIVLLSLAVGSGLGGRLYATRDTGATSRVLLLGAAALAVASFLALRLRFGGSLVTCTILFAVPLGACGAAMPALVGALSTGGRRGAAAGRLLAANTLGGVLGVLVTPLWALPEHGTERSLLFAAAALFVASALARALPASEVLLEEGTGGVPAGDALGLQDGATAATLGRSGSRGAWVSLVALGTGIGLLLLRGGPLRTDPGQVLELETGYQTVRLIEKKELGPMPGPVPLYGPTAEVPVRFLRFDEDTAAYQSVRVLEDEARLLTGGRYYDHLALGAWFEGQPWTRPAGGDPRVLMIGYCGGTLHRVLNFVTPVGRAGADVLGVELDPAVAKLGRERLGEVPGRLDLRTGEDGRTVVNELPANAVFDLILVDAYTRTQYVPFQLATREFFSACRAHLSPTGALGVNVNAPGGLSGHLLGALAETLSAAFEDGGVWIVPNPQYDGSAAVWATTTRRAPRVAGGVPATLATPAFALDRLLVRWVRPRAPQPVPTVLVDDRAPVERLADEDLLHESLR